ncbi:MULTISPECIES: LysR family transcriptional regulator [Paenibacillus]|uniref:LysR family transcriptional regulator n=1 Tax=Paenibacillus lautus TaxID=1401 RepID=A0A1R1ANC3_PAELA|nr:LysR family transcriptional regulator [Paenibacillus lautus]OME87069.1 LysR family transcriptional regulator [Paenibacillus lautus]
MNLQQLKVFVLAVKLQKLYLVAEKLNIRQPTVTFHLNKLQEEQGVPLFVTKSYHVIKLTPAGKALYHYAANIIAQTEEIEALMGEFRHLRGARLTIGSTHSPATYILPPLLAELKSQNPQLSILLDVKPAPVIIGKIKSFELDFGLVTQVQIDDPDLIAEPLMEDDLVVIFHPDHPFARMATLSPYDLSAYPFISHEEGSVSRKIFEQWAAEHIITLDVAMEVSGSEAMKSLVRQQLGFAILSGSSVQRETADGLLGVHRIPNWSYRRRFYMIREKNKLVSPIMQSFMEVIASRLS